MKKNIYITFLLVFYVAIALCQDVNYRSYHPIANPSPPLPNAVSRDYLPPSPMASSLGVFGNIPVGNYTGAIQLDLPLHVMKYKELSVPISLFYDQSGNKPDNIPSSVGLSWSLLSGGCITRIINGRPDIGPDLSTSHTGQGSMHMDPRYLENWKSFDLNTYTSILSGIYFDRKNIYPDKYVFNFNGFSGSFYPYDQIKDSVVYKLQSKEGEALSIMITSEGDDVIENLVYYTFTVIDSKGTKYIFGGRDATEYTKSGVKKGSMTFENYELINPTAWWLKEIESIHGYKIEFEYSKRRFTHKSHYTDHIIRYTKGLVADLPQERGDSIQKWNGIESLLIYKIKSPSEEITFNYSEQKNPLTYPQLSNNMILGIYEIYEFSGSNSNPSFTRLDERYNNSPVQLDHIVISNKLDQQTSINFTYYSQSQHPRRLILYSIDQYYAEVKIPQYKFNYNFSDQLPRYMSEETDYYGFYNNKLSFTNDALKDKDIIYLTCYLGANSDPNYWNKLGIDSLKRLTNRLIKEIDDSKEPDEYFGQMNILTEITYPTGGKSKFYYESHKYGRIFNRWPFEIRENENHAELPTGGVRIKRIVDYDNSGVELSKKIYHYVKDYKSGGTISSGVLSYIPRYVDAVFDKYMINGNREKSKRTFARVCSNPVFPLHPLGNHITYSEVTVEEPGNGFTTYKYKNYDNGYADLQPYSYASTIYADNEAGTLNPIRCYENDPGISMDLERGQLLLSEVYDKDKKIKKRIDLKYNDDNARFNKSVRYLRHEPTTMHRMSVNSYRFSLGEFFTYFPYLKEKTETTYFGSGNDVKEVVQKEQFTCDEDYRLVKSIRAFNNSNEEYLTEYQYTVDQDTTVSLIQNMMDRSMFANLFEKKVTVPNGQSTKEMYEYRDNFNVDSIPLLYKTKTQFPDNSVRVNSIIPRYDLLGNPAEINHYTDENLCVIWGYKGQYPVARVKNATYNQILSILGENTIEEILNSSTLSDSHIAALNNLRSNPLLQDAYISTYSYIPGVGMDSETNPMGITTHYLYDGFGRLTSVTDDDGNRLEGYDYHYKQ